MRNAVGILLAVWLAGAAHAEDATAAARYYAPTFQPIFERQVAMLDLFDHCVREVADCGYTEKSQTDMRGQIEFLKLVTKLRSRVAAPPRSAARSFYDVSKEFDRHRKIFVHMLFEFDLEFLAQYGALALECPREFDAKSHATVRAELARIWQVKGPDLESGLAGVAARERSYAQQIRELSDADKCQSIGSVSTGFIELLKSRLESGTEPGVKPKEPTEGANFENGWGFILTVAGRLEGELGNRSASDFLRRL